MSSEEYLKKDITITREERLSREGKSLSFLSPFPRRGKTYATMPDA